MSVCFRGWMNPITNTGICSIFLIFREASLVIPIEKKNGKFKDMCALYFLWIFFFSLPSKQTDHSREVSNCGFVKLASEAVGQLLPYQSAYFKPQQCQVWTLLSSHFYNSRYNTYRIARNWTEVLIFWFHPLERWRISGKPVKNRKYSNILSVLLHWSQ